MVALHVVPVELIYPPTGGKFDFYALLGRAARESFTMLARRKKLKPSDCRFIVARSTNFAETIVREAKKLRAADRYGEPRQDRVAATAAGKRC